MIIRLSQCFTRPLLGVVAFLKIYLIYDNFVYNFIHVFGLEST